MMSSSEDVMSPERNIQEPVDVLADASGELPHKVVPMVLFRQIGQRVFCDGLGEEVALPGPTSIDKVLLARR